MKKGIQFVFVVLAACLFISQPVKADRPESCTYLEWDLLRQTNDKRISEGISPISSFDALQDAIHTRANELLVSYSHTRPDGRSCFTALRENNIYYTTGGENIAKGQDDTDRVIDAWWNSPGHKRNMLGPGFVHMGNGYAYDKATQCKHHWAQLFVGGCKLTKISVYKGNEEKKYNVGTTIEQMKRCLVVTCDNHGTSYLPLSESLCSEYDKDAWGVQKVTVKYRNLETTFTVNLVPSAKKITYQEEIIPKGYVDTSTNDADTTDDDADTPDDDETTAKKAIRIKWKKAAKANGYIVYRATSKKGPYKKIKTIKKRTTTSYTDKKVKANKKYYYKVKIYQKVNKKTKIGKAVKVRSQKWVK